MKIDEKLYQEIKEFCKLNEIKDVNKYINELLKEAYMKQKWGEKPTTTTAKPKNKENKENPKPKTTSDFFSGPNTDIYNE